MTNREYGASSAEARSESRPPAPRAIDLRRGRTPEVEILACETYDLLLALHVALASPEYDYADYDIGRGWIESARTRLNAADPNALRVLGTYLGNGQSGSLHATLISLVWQSPEPRDPEHFLDWLGELPSDQMAEALLDSEGLGADWLDLLQLALEERGTGRESALTRLLARYSDDARPTVRHVIEHLDETRAELLGALRIWHETVFQNEAPRIRPLLRREAEALERQRTERPLEPFIEQTMRGVQWQRPAGLRRIVFAPSYFCRPAVFYHFWHGTLTFCVPVEQAIVDAETHSADPGAPGEDILRYFEALGDPTRLRILRLLSEREMYLTELSERLGLTKATTKHHMVRLRAAGLVTLYDRERLTYYALRPEIARHAAQLLESYLGTGQLR